MRRITLLLMVMAAALLAVSGVAWAATKTCPPEPKVCMGTSGADVLKSTSQNNDMVGKGGNDTYTNFAKGNFGQDAILDSGGKDRILLTNYSVRELKLFYYDANNNGKIDSLLIEAPKTSGPNAIVILGHYDDRSKKCPKPDCRPGSGYIEDIRAKK
jgi:hypothetical protein